jgi:hypothetical protein
LNKYPLSKQFAVASLKKLIVHAQYPIELGDAFMQEAESSTAAPVTIRGTGLSTLKD